MTGYSKVITWEEKSKGGEDCPKNVESGCQKTRKGEQGGREKRGTKGKGPNVIK